MKTLVMYRTVSGFTKKYAEWIAESLNADLVDARQVDQAVLPDYDRIVFGGSLHEVGVHGVDIVLKNLPKLEGKRIAVFTTGASLASEAVLREVENRNFTPEQKSRIGFFYLRGGFDFGKLDLRNKIMMTLLKWKIQMKRERTPDEKGMLAAYSTPLDFTKKEHIRKIVEYMEA